MFIKNIIVYGFRSYREQSFPDGLSDKVNVIVGRNGSGKSNFFAAIQFVLSERYTNLSAAERKELFHVGSGRPALSVFVEIVFDNSDGRLVIPGRTEEAEVRIRRTVGLKQDEFRVNDRKFSAADVRQLLESAGFSSSNPYYIVEQGKITSLANMSEGDRYNLIKDVAGTKVYEARREESERILAETETKQQAINDSIATLERKLKELESDTAELKEFQEADLDKRCIEYTILNAELQDARDALTKLDDEWNSHASPMTETGGADASVEQQIQLCSQQVSDLTSRVATLEGERKLVERELTSLSNRKALTDLSASDTAGQQSRNHRERVALEKEFVELSSALERTVGDLAEKRKTFDDRRSEADAIFSRVQQRQRRLDRLQEKRSRRALFKTKAERDEWIAKEKKRNEQILVKMQADLASVKQEIQNVDALMKADTRQATERADSTENVEMLLAAHEAKISAALAKRDERNQERRRLWQSVHEQESVVQRMSENHQNARRQLDRALRNDIRLGLQSLREVVSELNDRKITEAVHGPLIELIHVAEGFETAVEITAGSALFHVVVDSFDVSTWLLEQMNQRRKPGRISFFPLDTCSSTPRDIPTTPECSPLLSQVTFSDRFKGVVAEVLGRTAVVTTLEVGAKVVEELQCDVVTVDGDQLARRGAITGGYIDRRNMKLVAFTKEKQLAASLVVERAKLESLCQQVASIEQDITNLLNELETLRSQNASTERKADTHLREARALTEHATRLNDQRDGLLATQRSMEKSIEGTRQLIVGLEEESTEDFGTAWTEQDEKELEALAEEDSQEKRLSLSLQASVTELATEVQLLEDTMRHLERRRSTVSDRVRELGWGTSGNFGLDKEQAAVNSEYKLLTSRLSSISKSVDKAIKELHQSEEELAALQSSRLSAAMKFQEKSDHVDRLQVQRNLVTQRRDDALQKIRKLGVLPASADRYASFSIGKLMHHLKLVNERLKGYSHVNRKAVDQFAALVETRNDLLSQKDTLAKELSGIHELMEHLDKKKDEAIERTYKQIQFQFEEVFKELVDTEDCVAELQLVKCEENKAQGRDPYRGARIRVSFGLGTAVSDQEQLSGGQKSLVTLALIFAIQRCDPAPFYLFDEIDAALDAEYRATVARMIHKQSAHCQFLIATFKTELLEQADKVCGIFFHNKVSRVQTISSEEGMKLLKQTAVDERKRQREETAVAE